MLATTYVADIIRENAGYIYNQLYRQVWLLHDEECILSQRGRHWYRDRVIDQIGSILGINSRKGLE